MVSEVRAWISLSPGMGGKKGWAPVARMMDRVVIFLIPSVVLTSTSHGVFIWLYVIHSG
jgi:hypothetical protein